jgi:translation initiation factor IF-3
MSDLKPDPNKRSYLLPLGCKNLTDVFKDACSEPSTTPAVYVNGKISAQQVRVVGERGRQVGIMPLSEALMLAKSSGVDLVEIAPLAKPPVCLLVDFGMFRYEQAKRRKRKK